MVLNRLDLVQGELPGLAEDLRRYRYLSDVVNHRCYPDALDDLRGKTHIGRDRAGKIGHPSLMPCRVRITHLDDVDYRLYVPPMAFRRLARVDPSLSSASLRFVMSCIKETM